MHYLVVAKVKDFPDVDDLMEALVPSDSEPEDSPGKWKLVAESIDEFISSNKDEIISEIDDDEMSFENKVSMYLEFFRLYADCDGRVWEKTSEHFDYCLLGGGFTNDKITDIVPYQKVIDEYGEVAAFVLADYGFYDTDDEECPFKPDDLVYIIDGHN